MSEAHAVPSLASQERELERFGASTDASPDVVGFSRWSYELLEKGVPRVHLFHVSLTAAADTKGQPALPLTSLRLLL